MIITEQEYKNSKKLVTQYEENEKNQIHALKEKGLTEEQINFVLSPSRHHHEQVKWEIEEYERYQKGDFSNISHAAGIGRLLVALRIYKRCTQSELAKRLGVSQAQVSKDERNEYHNVSHNKMLQVLQALEMDFQIIPQDLAAGKVDPIEMKKK
ncbi:helix-turn-helix protein [Hazenella coriacea]|uniref:Helix-turn-helix protein n=1 Tax=Hazenella coriacea TaxID=1179467 RepID=A0A4R3LC39_9BACL|nr:helix-turn-helix protein [Hazenella coriacea]